MDFWSLSSDAQSRNARVTFVSAAPTYLGLDLGTSGLRGLLMSARGEVITVAEATYNVSRPHQGWSEQDPADWIEAVKIVVDILRGRESEQMKQLAGIGVSGHMHGAVLLDDQGVVLRPCILWNDTRSAQEAAHLDAIDEVRALSGNIVFPGFTAPKLVWVAKNQPDIFARVSKVLLPAAYLNFWLTGNYVGDISDASGTGWLETGARAWSDKLLREGGMTADQMPRLVEGSQFAGYLRAELRDAWQLPSNVVVAGGGGDNAVAACGVGLINESDAFVSLGTSGVILTARETYQPAPDTAVHTFCHAIPDRWYQMGVILSATDCLNWAARQFDQSPAELTGALGTELRPPSSVKFLPYLSGERTPHNDSTIRGAFIGCDIAHSRNDLVQAILEGVAFALRDTLEALKAAGSQIDRLIAIGGGSASQYWLELLATVLSLPLDIPRKGEFGAALGAARLGHAAHIDGGHSTIMTKPEIAQTVQPNPQHAEAFDRAWTAWTNIYPTLRTLS